MSKKVIEHPSHVIRNAVLTDGVYRELLRMGSLLRVASSHSIPRVNYNFSIRQERRTRSERMGDLLKVTPGEAKICFKKRTLILRCKSLETEKDPIPLPPCAICLALIRILQHKSEKLRAFKFPTLRA